MANIYFFYLDVQPNLPNRTALKLFIKNIFKQENKPFSALSYIFCTDEYLLYINKNYLQHHYYTDIITFPLHDKNTPVMGEIYISIDRVKENAHTMGCTFKEEIHRVIFHGALHLCGYKDKSAIEQQQMRNREDHYLKQYFSK